MSATITPIRSGEPPNGSTPKKARRRRATRPDVRLLESDELDGYATLDLINGLHGVSVALDTCCYQGDRDMVANLHTAAKVLAAILAGRVNSL